MDYSSSNDDTVSDSGHVSDEPEIINETFESVEPEFTEMAHDVDTDKNTPIDQTSATASDDVLHHAKLDGIEVPGSPDAEGDMTVPESSADNTSVTEGQSDFQLETDVQIHDAVSTLSENEDIKPENWEGLAENERLSTLQNVENDMAEIQGREPISVIAEESMESAEYGGYNEGDKSIHINRDHMIGEKPVEENIDTLIHEGRHAFQDYAINSPGVVSNIEVLNQWRENMDNYVTPQEADFEEYINQPLEADVNFPPFNGQIVKENFSIWPRIQPVISNPMLNAA